MDIPKERIVISRTPKQESDKDNKTIKRMCKQDVSWRNLTSNRDTQYVLEEDKDYFRLSGIVRKAPQDLETVQEAVFAYNR